MKQNDNNMLYITTFFQESGPCHSVDLGSIF